MWAPCSAPRRSLAHPREGVLVGHVPVGSLVPHQAPKNVPTPATRKASQGQPTSLTAWASLLAWGQGVRAAFLEGKERQTGIRGQQSVAPGEPARAS